MQNEEKTILVREIIASYFKTTPTGIFQIHNKGITNDVFEVSLAQSKVIIRISHEPNTSQFEKEKWEMEQATLLDILTPKVIHIGLHNNIPYMIEEFIEGVHGTESHHASHIWTELGKYAKKIHSIPITGFGDLMTTPGNFESNRSGFSGYLDYNISSLDDKDKLLQMNILTKSKSEMIKTMFENLKEVNFKFGLNHGDLSLKNVIVDSNNKVFLLDWGSSEVNIIPLFDFIEIMQSSFDFDHTNLDFIAFIHGYGLTEQEFLAMKPNIDTLFLLSAIDKLRWAIDNKPEKIDYFRGRLEKGLNDLKL